jgi:hypothetical protein
MHHPALAAELELNRLISPIRQLDRVRHDFPIKHQVMDRRLALTRGGEIHRDLPRFKRIHDPHMKR